MTMPISLPPDAKSICWTCRYWDWAIELRMDDPSEWVNECHHPAEYVAADNVADCDGYGEDTEK